jgi:hypothetical protein
MRYVAIGLLVLICLVASGCQGEPAKPEKLTPDKEQQLQQQLEKSRQAEGAAARKQ